MKVQLKCLCRTSGRAQTRTLVVWTEVKHFYPLSALFDHSLRVPSPTWVCLEQAQIFVKVNAQLSMFDPLPMQKTFTSFGCVSQFTLESLLCLQLVCSCKLTCKHLHFHNFKSTWLILHPGFVDVCTILTDVHILICLFGVKINVDVFEVLSLDSLIYTL